MHLLFIKEAPANAAENGNSTDKNEVTQNKEKFFREYKGTVLGPNDMDEIESMEIREDDVFAVSFPRSGNALFMLYYDVTVFSCFVTILWYRA